MKEIKRIESQQTSLRTLLEELRTLQESYIQLYPQFLSGMLGKIPGAASKFEAIDQQWRNTIELIRTRECKYIPSAFSIIDNEEVFNNIRDSNKICEEIYCNMETYIFHMRQKCPRLYLLSNSQVLKMLSISKYPLLFDSLLKIISTGG